MIWPAHAALCFETQDLGRTHDYTTSHRRTASTKQLSVMRTVYFLLALLPAVAFGGLLSDSIIKILITSDGGESTKRRSLCVAVGRGRPRLCSSSVQSGNALAYLCAGDPFSDLTVPVSSSSKQFIPTEPAGMPLSAYRSPSL